MGDRKHATTREKELELAIHRIERGRARTNADKLSISAVAREAGVTPALIHNHYPSIAEQIRVKQGASSRQQRDAKRNELAEERRKNAELRAELGAVKARLQKLATLNEMLVIANRELSAKRSSDNIVDLRPQN
ncbi:Transcriptional regulator, TetR family [Burkholderia sp. 8Y]|uniref:TetR family transcriptional regulator n=1 Tax=Burkholderia sp. 8Y TaxID=2653133 RepID=UPI0012F04FC9|nr:TetR family transcriptional regulator [Burkholderia sp. 8Y]VXB46417.1 Transcriptional regulator, TetR family [Burkholderia sp. 8Y]